MKLTGVLFLAAYTARSQAYAQSMAAKGLSPEAVLLFGGDSQKSTPISKAQDTRFPGSKIFLPDLSVSLHETCQRAMWDIHFDPATNVNGGEIKGFISEFKPQLVIYSGYGGQIVSSELLDLRVPFLHVHAGWLPEERGSTTIYYSLIREGRCSATAFLLEREIDAGPILARKHYPRPPAGIDVDYLYDSAIRADLLLDVLDDYHRNGRLPDPLPLDQCRKGRTYYIIHPVLKHIALLSLSQDN